MTEQEFVQRVELMSRRLEVQSPKIKIAPAKGRDALRVRLSGWTLRVTTRTLSELSDAEIQFGITLAFLSRLEPNQKRPLLVVAPFASLTFIGLAIVTLARESFVERFYLGFAILFGLMVIGYVAGMFISVAVDENARSQILGEALNLTGNASAAETYLIRCKTDHLLSGRRKLASIDRDQLEDQLDALKAAARRLGLSYVPAGFGD